MIYYFSTREESHIASLLAHFKEEQVEYCGLSCALNSFLLSTNLEKSEMEYLISSKLTDLKGEDQPLFTIQPFHPDAVLSGEDQSVEEWIIQRLDDDAYDINISAIPPFADITCRDTAVFESNQIVKKIVATFAVNQFPSMEESMPLNLVLSGPKGSGKTSFAREIAKSILTVLPAGQFYVLEGTRFCADFLSGFGDDLDRTFAKLSGKGGVVLLEDFDVLIPKSEEDPPCDEMFLDLVNRYKRSVSVLITTSDKPLAKILLQDPYYLKTFSHHLSLSPYSVDELFEITSHKLTKVGFEADDRTKTLLKACVSAFAGSKQWLGKNAYIADHIYREVFGQWSLRSSDSFDHIKKLHAHEADPDGVPKPKTELDATDVPMFGSRKRLFIADYNNQRRTGSAYRPMGRVIQFPTTNNG